MCHKACRRAQVQHNNNNNRPPKAFSSISSSNSSSSSSSSSDQHLHTPLVLVCLRAHIHQRTLLPVSYLNDFEPALFVVRQGDKVSLASSASLTLSYATDKAGKLLSAAISRTAQAHQWLLSISAARTSLPLSEPNDTHTDGQTHGPSSSVLNKTLPPVPLCVCVRVCLCLSNLGTSK